MNKLYLLLFILLASASGATAQKFWLLTYEFPGREKTGLVGAADTFLYVGLTNGVLRSGNEGLSWDTVFIGHSVYSLYANHKGLVLAGGSGKIYRSLNYGHTWDSATVNTAYPVIEFAEDTTGNLYAVNGYSDVSGYVGGGVYFSADTGTNWAQRNNGLGAYRSCDQVATDRHGRVYVTLRDDFVSGNAGLFISDNQGQLWEHIDIRIDGDGAINNDMKVEYTTGLTISAQDSVYISFLGVSTSVAVRFNACKHTSDIRSAGFWGKIRIATGPTWWQDKPLHGILFARNGDRYSSVSGTPSFGGTCFLKSGAAAWSKHNQGLGLTVFGDQGEQFFYEKSSGKVFMVQYMDERVYWQDTSIITALPGEVITDKLLSIYPNPVGVNGSVNLAGTGGTLTITDIQGRRVFYDNCFDNKAVQAPGVAGLYFIVLQQGNQRQCAKLMVR